MVKIANRKLSVVISTLFKKEKKEKKEKIKIKKMENEGIFVRRLFQLNERDVFFRDVKIRRRELALGEKVKDLRRELVFEKMRFNKELNLLDEKIDQRLVLAGLNRLKLKKVEYHLWDLKNRN